MSSAFPKSFAELVTEAKQLARDLGELPSQNKLKAALHVRAERAKAVLQTLKDSGFDPREPEPEASTPRRLHLVPGTSAEPVADPRGDAEEFDEIAGVLPADPNTDRVGSGDADVSPVVVRDHAEPVASAKAVRWVRGLRDRCSPSVWGAESGERPVRSWPVVLLAAPAFVAIWSGWVGLGVLTGFGVVHPLPGIVDHFTINSAITLPVGVETYAAYALRVWLAAGVGTDHRARQFAKWSAIGALVLGAAGQIAYHLMTAEHITAAPWWITTGVSCLPVVVLGFGTALAHLQHHRTEAVR